MTQATCPDSGLAAEQAVSFDGTMDEIFTRMLEGRMKILRTARGHSGPWAYPLLSSHGRFVSQNEDALKRPWGYKYH